MNYKLLFTATVCAAAFCAAPVHADYTSWQDPSYDFSKISRIYVGRVDMSDVALSSARQKSLETTFASRMNKAKIPKDVMLTIEAPTASKSLSVSRVQKASAESGTEEAEDLFEAAKSANAQVYILPRLTRWQVKTSSRRMWSGDLFRCGIPIRTRMETGMISTAQKPTPTMCLPRRSHMLW